MNTPRLVFFESCPFDTVPLMRSRSHFRQGVYASCGIVLCIAVYLFGQSAMTYHGTCGGLWFGLSGPQPCSFWSYMSSDLTLVIGIGGVVFGPMLAGILLIPPLVGSALDRRRRTSGAQSILLFTALGFLAAPSVTWMVMRNATVDVVAMWSGIGLLCVGSGAVCMFVGGVLLDTVD